MNIKITIGAIFTILLFILLYGIEESLSDVTSSGSTTNTQSNNAGSNTAITGGYESSTTYQSGSSSNTTTSNTTNNSTNQETAGVTVIGFSGSFGSYMIDKECERRKASAVLAKLGMKVASISLMCQDENVWKAMMNAGTPCPIDGLIGQKAKARWIEIGGFHQPDVDKWNGKPIPSGMISSEED